MRENGIKKLIDSFSGTMCELSQQFSVTIKEPTQYFGDSKYPLTVRDIVQDIIFNP